METTLTSGQLQSTLTLLKQKGMTPERYNRLLESGILADILSVDPEHFDSSIRIDLATMLGLDLVGVELEIDYTLDLSDLIACCWFNGVVADKRFLHRLHPYGPCDVYSGTTVIKCDAIEVKDWKTRDEAVAWMTQRKLRPANPIEFFRFDLTHFKVATNNRLFTWGDFLRGKNELEPASLTIASNVCGRIERSLFIGVPSFPSHSAGGRMLLVHTE